MILTNSSGAIVATGLVLCADVTGIAVMIEGMTGEMIDVTIDEMTEETDATSVETNAGKTDATSVETIDSNGVTTTGLGDSKRELPRQFLFYLSITLS